MKPLQCQRQIGEQHEIEVEFLHFKKQTFKIKFRPKCWWSALSVVKLEYLLSTMKKSWSVHSIVVFNIWPIRAQPFLETFLGLLWEIKVSDSDGKTSLFTKWRTQEMDRALYSANLAACQIWLRVVLFSKDQIIYVWSRSAGMLICLKRWTSTTVAVNNYGVTSQVISWLLKITRILKGWGFFFVFFINISGECVRYD